MVEFFMKRFAEKYPGLGRFYLSVASPFAEHATRVQRRPG
jgi:hypothetical protein